eukprot:SAG11_NODE_23714_length_384_cov_0.719298_1_plen_78_part_10
MVEEQATALLRTAMSVIVREGGDLSCGIFDLAGRMMAQAVRLLARAAVGGGPDPCHGCSIWHPLCAGHGHPRACELDG